MSTIEQISSVIANQLSGTERGDFAVETRTNFSRGGLDGDEKGRATLTLHITNPGIETDPAAQEFILSRLSQIPALADNVQFESPRKHAETMGQRLKEFQAEDPSSGIPANYVTWFEQQAKQDAAKVANHALNVEKNDTGIRLYIDVPKAVDPSTVAQNVEGRMEAIKNTLADRAVKYTPGLESNEQKDALRQKVKNLDVAVTTQTDDFYHRVVIEIRSKEQLAAVKDAKTSWSVVLDSEQAKTLRESNPLLSLKDGDGSSPENPAYLQKALARSFLFAGEKAQEVFPLIAGREDMRRAVIKSLVRLKQKEVEAGNTEKVQQIEKFLDDDMFKKQDRWALDTGLKLQPTISKAGAITAADGTERYTPGKLVVNLDLPADKFKAILDEVAAYKASGMTAEQTSLGTAIPAYQAPKDIIGSIAPAQTSGRGAA